MVSGPPFLTSSATPFSGQSSQAITCTTLTSISIRGRKPLTFAFLSQRSMELTMGMDICKLKNATFEMAIATFFHVIISLMQSLSHRDFYGLCVCAALLERIMLRPIKRKLVETCLTSITQMPTSKIRKRYWCWHSWVMAQPVIECL